MRGTCHLTPATLALLQSQTLSGEVLPHSRLLSQHQTPEETPPWPARTLWGLLFSAVGQHQHQLPKHVLPAPREVLSHKRRQVQGRPRGITGRKRRARWVSWWCSGPRQDGSHGGSRTDLSSCRWKCWTFNWCVVLFLSHLSLQRKGEQYNTAYVRPAQCHGKYLHWWFR